MSRHYKAEDVEREIERLLRFRDENDFDLAIRHGIETVKSVLKDLPTIEVSEDYISRADLLKDFGLSEKSRKYGGDHSGYQTLMLYEIQDIIEDAPSVIPKPKEGEWIEDEYGIPHCSECNCINNTVYRNFCPNCGAKMCFE